MNFSPHVLPTLLMLTVFPIACLSQFNQTFDSQPNTISRVAFYTTNYGTWGLNASTNTGGVIFPRGTQNQYIFGTGFWFTAMKRVDGTLQKLCDLSYNPRTGVSWMSPGDISDGDTALTDLAEQYQIYNSVHFNSDASSKKGVIPWCTWVEDNRIVGDDGYLGSYIPDITKRNTANYKSGHAILSNEDIISYYKDTDLRLNEDGHILASKQGYPLRIQTTERIYSWQYGLLRNTVLIVYEIQNRSTDTLFNCSFTKVTDFDLLVNGPNWKGYLNDYIRYYNEDPLLQLVVGWTGTDQGELGKGFGYAGVSLIETPSVDTKGFLKGFGLFPISEQLGLKTFPHWTESNDPLSNSERYDFVSGNTIETKTFGPEDIRSYLTTGKFHLRPNETVRVAVAYVFANTSLGTEANGTKADMAELVSGVKIIRDSYYNGELSTEVYDNHTDESAPVAIVPNPATSTVRITTPQSHNLYSFVTISNILGETVFYIPISETNTSDKDIIINVSAIPQGVYRVALTGIYSNVSATLLITR